MRIRFSTDVMADQTAWGALDELLFLFVRDWHVWDIEDAEVLESSEWFRDGGSSVAALRKQDLYQKAFTNAAYNAHTRGEHSRLITVTLSVTSGNDVAYTKIVEWCQLPVYVVVENARNDGAFIQTAIHVFEYSRLAASLNTHRWTFCHAGGINEIPYRIQEYIDSYTPAPRIFVVIDSDSRFPGQIGDAQRNVSQYCSERGIDCHVLRKRSIENYIVSSVLKAFCQDTQFLNAFQKLTSEQKDFFPLKTGFGGDYRGGGFRFPEQERLYRNVDRATRRELYRGIPGLAEAFTEKRQAFTANEVSERCAPEPSELKRILNKIEALL